MTSLLFSSESSVGCTEFNTCSAASSAAEKHSWLIDAGSGGGQVLHLDPRAKCSSLIVEFTTPSSTIFKVIQIHTTENKKTDNQTVNRGQFITICFFTIPAMSFEEDGFSLPLLSHDKSRGLLDTGV